MHRSEAQKWFWPFVGIAAVAAAIVIGLSAFVQSKAMSGEPEFRMVIAVTAQPEHGLQRTSATTEPGHVEVAGTRSPSIIERLAALLPRRERS
jgi:hypothetical protein